MSLKGFEEMTVAELHAFLTERGKAGDADAMKWNTKTRKAELVTLAKEANRRKHAADAGTANHRPGFTEVYGGEIDLSKPVELPSVESAHRMVEAFAISHPRAAARARHAARMAKTKTSRVDKTTPNRIVRMVRASQSRRYGQSGRGVGAKHYRSSLCYTNGGPVVRHYRPNPLGSKPDAFKPLAYGDRVRHYTKQLGQPTAKVDGFPGPLLTPRQWRRIEHKNNKLMFGPNPSVTKERRYV